MHKFFTTLGKFFILPLAVIIFFILYLVYVSSIIEYRINSDISTLYIGDSHLQCAVNDQLLSHSKNVSNSSESIYFTYYKLKKLIEVNPSIQQVYLGLSYHSISNYYDDFISGVFSPTVSPNYFFALPFKEQVHVFQWNLKNLPTFLKGLIAVCIQYTNENNRFNYGNYFNIFDKTMARDSSMDKRLVFQYFKGNQLNDISMINLEYLSKLIDLCKSHHIQLFILNTPLHPYYRNKIPSMYISKYNALIQAYPLNLVQLHDLALTDSCFIPDGDHLSQKGALLYTKALLNFNALNSKH